ncbi:MAG TPA: CPBP family intramembrane glutamic endopeptidase [Polyangia bacterium]|nr:CPBP family intramembrane glutamic endopeptidase [Polyangia bacterium]HVY36978.1 CPBP family intramembrane glutamic endopeptidase [Polyangia bacterium]
MSAGAVAEARRSAEACLFVAVWIGAGFALRLRPDAYLLLGVPLTVVFQLLVARRPLRAAWLRQGAELRLDGRWLALAAALAFYPAWWAVHAFRLGLFAAALWGVAAMVGGGAAAFAIRNRRPETGREAVRCLGTAGAIGAGFMILAALSGVSIAHHLFSGPVHGLRSLILYFPACFVLEEVTFRGVLDAHVAPQGEGTWRSAALVSALWGIWHLPVLPSGTRLLPAVAALLMVHVSIGVYLSFGWRRSGNLAVPALAHAAIDAIRNALLI